MTTKRVRFNYTYSINYYNNEAINRIKFATIEKKTIIQSSAYEARKKLAEQEQQRINALNQEKPKQSSAYEARKKLAEQRQQRNVHIQTNIAPVNIFLFYS